MANAESNLKVVQSLLDRLDDRDADGTRQHPEAARPDDRQLRQSVLRDLESLLNTRNTFAERDSESAHPSATPLGEAFQHARSSVLAYGLPDVTGANSATSGDRDSLLFAAIYRAIRYFEPRLSEVKLSLDDGSEGDGEAPGARRLKRVVSLRVEARLRLDPLIEPIQFDITMPASPNHYEIKDAG